MSEEQVGDQGMRGYDDGSGGRFEKVWACLDNYLHLWYSLA